MITLEEDDLKLASQIESGLSIATLCPSSRTYRRLTTNILFQFAASELACASGFALSINSGPTLADRIELSGVVHEKLLTADRVYGLLSELGVKNDQALTAWRQAIETTCSSINLSVPEVEKDHASARD